jgi:hypothetical protein
MQAVCPAILKSPWFDQLNICWRVYIMKKTKEMAAFLDTVLCSLV